MHKQKNISYQTVFKRPLDVALALIALFLLSPVFLIVALLVRMKLGKPILFKQQRPGLHGELFTMYKFRTMLDQHDSNGQQLEDKDRLTSFGKKLRATSLDEIPELFNILKGNMSIVGPRPLLVEYLPLYSEYEKRRHEVKPGLTGLAQINGRNAISWDEKFEFDINYVDNITLAKDLKIMTATAVKVLRRDSINSNSSATMEPYKGK
ncbi:sugar transferase [Alkalicoccus luteus]|uniref:Sugar transferase n=1 Tax=Alkalicoccus luteus TaxID=1237094 RepID=A0A969TUV1_9BACI|nr:sugar transferase [Alkalicoccus luteus]NJP37447.1 sugar transferase [Alkalicoccus luteus]